MPHIFDTALTTPQRTLVMNGAVLALSAKLRSVDPVNGYLAAVSRYGSVVRSWADTDGVSDLFNTLMGQAPAIAVALGDKVSKAPALGGYQFQQELELLVYFLSNHSRGLVDGRMIIDNVAAASNTADPGLHVMMEHAEELLIGLRCGASTTIKQIRPDREEELLSREGLTLWLQTYRITLSRTINEYRNVTQFLDDIRVRTTQEDGELKLPNAPTKGTTIDAYGAPLPPPTSP